VSIRQVKSTLSASAGSAMKPRPILAAFSSGYGVNTVALLLPDSPKQDSADPTIPISKIVNTTKVFICNLFIGSFYV
jgi:hypothetical protein